MKKKITNQELIERFKKIHGNKYNYSRVDYISMHTKVCIICPIHGEFWQTPHNHLKGQNCPKCANIVRGNSFRDTQEEFIKRAKAVHGDKYDYSKVNYINNRTKVCIICPEHGEFWQIPYSHLQGFGCSLCNNIVCDTVSFVTKAREIYDNTYDYSKVNYVHSKEKVCIICPKHDEFYVTPNNFLRGHSCPICKQSKLENEIRTFLEFNKIKFEAQRRFNWLGLKKLDFYLPELNISIECQGGQHFKSVGWFGGKEGFLEQKKSDKMKKILCEEHGIKILYFTHEDYKLFLGEQLIKSTNELLKKIKEYKKEEPEKEEEQ